MYAVPESSGILLNKLCNGENYHSTQASEACSHLVDWVTLGDKAIYWADSLETASRPINCLATVLGPINHLETVPGPIAVFWELFLPISSKRCLANQNQRNKALLNYFSTDFTCASPSMAYVTSLCASVEFILSRIII